MARQIELRGELRNGKFCLFERRCSSSRGKSYEPVHLALNGVPVNLIVKDNVLTLSNEGLEMSLEIVSSNPDSEDN